MSVTKKKNQRWQMTRLHHDELVSRWKKEYGRNMLDWPPFLREKYRTIEILPEVTVELKQHGFPFSDTGVSGRPQLGVLNGKR